MYGVLGIVDGVDISKNHQNKINIKREQGSDHLSTKPKVRQDLLCRPSTQNTDNLMSEKSVQTQRSEHMQGKQQSQGNGIIRM